MSEIPKMELLKSEKVTNQEDIKFLKELMETSIQLGKKAEDSIGHLDMDEVLLYYGTMKELKKMYNVENLKMLNDVFGHVGSIQYSKK